MARRSLLTAQETCHAEGSEGLGGGGRWTAVATERPCLLFPNNAPSFRPRGVLGQGWAPVQLLAGAASVSQGPLCFWSNRLPQVLR